MVSKISTITEKLAKYSSLFQPCIYINPDFLHILQPKKKNWNRLKAEAAVRIQLSPVKPDVRQICRS